MFGPILFTAGVAVIVVLVHSILKGRDRLDDILAQDRIERDIHRWRRNADTIAAIAQQEARERGTK